MSNSKMLIDAAHPEETRVVVLKGNRIEEFDFESASKKQLRGNIYLAKVTRVEPSLQAAFVEYGGNRHGFLAFSEIHPDYYQIPFADRQALLEEEARAHRDEDDEGRGNGVTESRNQGGGENRRDGKRQEGRGNGEGRSQDRGQGERSQGEGGERQARSEGRGERGSRSGERGQRRSRRHRRDHAPASALERRGAGDDSISESLVDGDAVELNEADTAVTTEIVDHAAVDQDGNDTAAHSAAPDHSGDAAVEAVEAETSQEEAMAAAAAPVDAPDAEAAFESPAPGGTDEPAAATAEAVDAPLAAETGEASAFEAEAFEPEASGADAVEAPHAVEPAAAVVEEATDAAASTTDTVGETVEARDTSDHQDDEHHEEEHVEQIGGDALSDVAPRPVRLRRHYKIQEVIKRRQILLIQVVKEERGNKGAALTTYLSLAGRYSVLMPNTAKGGGISRKITDGEDRKRLKAIAQELDVPEGMGVILRTAGAARSPIEVRRDFEYLLRMWESVRELTLKSSAPSLVYEEGSLIKRSIRDLYSKEVEEIVVSGEAGFAEARDFMRMLMPGNVKSVQSYRDPQPIFAKSGVEAQLDAMFSPHVTLKSGGYLVINQTEALVAIDVNSGRSTREHNIEDTALRTNLEAADEVARQLRLRDLAGLIVVDFIDMEEGRNNRAVERRIKEALKNDRARIQIGRISHFGLLEMSRQRIRTGVLEGSTVVCPHCAGAGTVRSTASIALHVLRLVEDALLKDASHDLVVRSRAEVALYMLNQKRAKLVELEQRFGVGITVTTDPSLTGMVYHAIERGEPAVPPIAPAQRQDLVRVDSIAPIFEPGSEDGDEEVATAEPVGEAEGDVDGESGSTEAGAAETGEGDSDGRRRKRRRRRRGRDRDGQAEAATGSVDAADEDADAADENRTEAAIDGEAVPVSALEGEASTGEAEEPAPVEASVASDAPESEPASTDADDVTTTAPAAPVAAAALEAVEAAPAQEPAAEEAPKRRRSRRTVVRVDESAGEATPPVAAPEEEAPARPRRRRTTRARAAVETTPAETIPAEGADAVATETVAAASPSEPPASEPTTATPVTEMAAEVAAEPLDTETAGDETAGEDPDRPKRSGWWQRAKASFGS